MKEIDVRKCQVYVAGEWLDRLEGLTTIRNPSNGQVVAEVPSLLPDHIDAAVSEAKASLRLSDWAYDGNLRAEVLLEWAARLEKNIESLAVALTEENGKLLSESRYEIASQVGVIRYNAGLARATSGRSHSLGRNTVGVVLREPIGVVAVISPWNWPVTLMVRDMAPALAAGNAVLCKPASQTAGVCVGVLRELVACKKLPKGILSMVTGSGSRVGQSIVEHPGVDMIAFTGDGKTGRNIARDSAKTLKKVTLELGGKSPFVLCADAVLDHALPVLIEAVFTTTSGQICTAPSRLLVESSLKDEVCAKLSECIPKIRVGDGMNPNADMGPLTTEGQYEKVKSYLEEGKRDGKLIAEGNTEFGPELSNGYFVAPAVFSELPPDSSLVREEIFGPVLVVQTFDGDNEAIELANTTEFGLAAAVFTENVHRAWKLSRAIEAGTVWVNTFNRFYPETEVGGCKSSGVGRMAGIDGLLEFTQTKHVNFESERIIASGQ